MEKSTTVTGYHWRKGDVTRRHRILSGRIPIGVRRPPLVREALGFSPLVQAGWADASGVKGIPSATAGAEPLVLPARRPAAERAPNAGAGGIKGFLLIWLAVDYEGSLVSHPRYYEAHERAN